jgi:hypothetical protein
MASTDDDSFVIDGHTDSNIAYQHSQSPSQPKSVLKKPADFRPTYGSIPPSYERHALRELYSREFYQRNNWFEALCETLFKIRARKTTIKAEIYYGVIHFISCLYCLAVVPQQLRAAHYNVPHTVVSVALCSGIGSLFFSLCSSSRIILAPMWVIWALLCQEHC